MQPRSIALALRPTVMDAIRIRERVILWEVIKKLCCGYLATHRLKQKDLTPFYVQWEISIEGYQHTGHL